MQTLLLDLSGWDLLADARGNIAVASDPYAKAQDVASACKTFLGELWFDVTKGVPWFEDILGQVPPRGMLESLMETAALTVPGVVQARCTIEAVEARRVTATLLFTDETGLQNRVTLTP
jgi:hypothetical protein